jgi:hypothetical protein
MEPTAIAVYLLVLVIAVLVGFLWRAMAHMDRTATAAEHAAEGANRAAEGANRAANACVTLAEQVRDRRTQRAAPSGAGGVMTASEPPDRIHDRGLRGARGHLFRQR